MFRFYSFLCNTYRLLEKRAKILQNNEFKDFLSTNFILIVQNMHLSLYLHTPHKLLDASRKYHFA